MQKQQVFKVKGMQRDASMANANGEFAYEIVNMRLMPAEEGAGFSLTNEVGTQKVNNIKLSGKVIGQCPTNDSLVVFTTDKDNTQLDYIYEIYKTQTGSWTCGTLYKGNLKFSENYPIETLFNYETEDIQKVYWIDGINQLRCIQLMADESVRKTWNDQTFDSIKTVDRLPEVDITRTTTGSFTAGVVQYYITYYNKYASESPIVYTSPLLYIAHSDRGALVNDQVAVGFKIKIFPPVATYSNWENIRIYITHRTSLDATPEASIVYEGPLPDNGSPFTIEDTGYSRIAIAPSDLQFVGGKAVLAGTMAVKDQVMFLGKLNIQSMRTYDLEKVISLFDKIRGTSACQIDILTRAVENDISNSEGTYYYNKHQLDNTRSITHYKYGEKYRFGISVSDKYMNWSNPIWLGDFFITVPPRQISSKILALPCPVLDLTTSVNPYDDPSISITIQDYLIKCGVAYVRPVVVYPDASERKVIAQGVVCPTVYNLKDRATNSPYAQSSWFMRPNVPVDLWGIVGDYIGTKATSTENRNLLYLSTDYLAHKSDLMLPYGAVALSSIAEVKNTSLLSRYMFGYMSPIMSWEDFGVTYVKGMPREPRRYVADDITRWRFDQGNSKTEYYSKFSRIEPWKNNFTLTLSPIETSYSDDHYNEEGSWLEFRHNYALRSLGWTFGGTTSSFSIQASNVDDAALYTRYGQPWVFGSDDIYREEQGFWANFETAQDENSFYESDIIYGMNRVAELAVSRAGYTLPVNRVWTFNEATTFRKGNTSDVDINFNVQNSAYYVDNSIITLNSPEFEFGKQNSTLPPNGAKFRIIGMIPITSTVSDSSLIVDNPTTNVDANETNVGYQKFTLKYNTNISYTGFKSMVASNYYRVNPDAINIGYRPTLIHPWNMVGSVEAVPPTDATLSAKDKLKQKVLSNLRYSACTYFFPPGNVTLYGGNCEENNLAFLSCNDDVPKSIGWEPNSDISVAIWNSDDTIVKLQNSLTNKDLIYSGSINSNAIAALDNNSSISVGFAYCTKWPAFQTNRNLMKVGVAAPITYKSSSHAVISLNAWKAYNESKWPKEEFKEQKFIVPEILPAIHSINVEGANFSSFDNYPARDNITYDTLPVPAFETCLGRVYEDEYISSVPHQSSIILPGDINSEYPLIPGYNGFVTNNGKHFTKFNHSYPEEVNQDLTLTYSYERWKLKDEEYEEDETYNYIMNIPNSNDHTVKIENQKYNVKYKYELWDTYVDQCDYSFLLDTSELEKIQENILSNDINSISEIEVNNFSMYIANAPMYLDGEWDGGRSIVKELQYSSSSVFIRNISIIQNGNNYAIKGSLELEWNDDDSSLVIDWLESPSYGGSNYEARERKFTLTINNINLGTIVELTQPFAQPTFGWLWLGELYREQDPTFGGTSDFALMQNAWEVAGASVDLNNTYEDVLLDWATGDTYYQRFDTLKTYAYSDKDQNSVVDITSFMVETHLNIDGRTDRNRGQINNLQMSPTNFNLFNDVYTQKDNIFVYRILDEDTALRRYFPTQITWSLTKSNGEIVDKWLTHTLASILDLDGTKGELTALKVFNNNIIAFQESGISNILFNSRAQIATSENVPIQLANTGKVDGQQYFTTDIGCQDKWNIVTTPQGLYWVDYNNKTIYKFNGQVEDLSTANGFRGWCDKNISSSKSKITGYYDKKNKEVMFHDSNFASINGLTTSWLGFSELTNAFSSFYTYPNARLLNIKDEGIWLYQNHIYKHQKGVYNELITSPSHPYGLTCITRQDSNLVKTFNNVEFRADTYIDEEVSPETPYPNMSKTFDTIQIEDEYNGKTTESLEFNQYRPSNLKKYLRTWRANIPRANNGHKRYVNQWAKVGLWMNKPGTEKTILHDMAVWYSE